MSVEQGNIYENKILETIPQRGEPPYFIHSGRGGMLNVVHGVTEQTWTAAIYRIGDLSNYGDNSYGEQVLVGLPMHTGLLRTD